MSELKTETLQLTAANLKLRLNSADEAEGWQFGENENYTETDSVELLQEKEDTCLSMLPEGYRRMSRSTLYHGECLARRAKKNQTTFTPKLLPLVEGTVNLYVNFPQDVPWISSERDDYRLEDSKFSVNWTSGLITIPSITENDRIYTTYEHGAGKTLRMLKRLALDLAIVQIARDEHIDVENYDIFKDLENNVYSTFKKFREKGDARIGIDMFDRMDLVRPLRDPGVRISW